MIELTDTFPDINVQPGEYKRLLGYPREKVLDGRALELAQWARAWYADRGRPWVYLRQAQNLQMNNGSVLLDGAPFHSQNLQKTLQQAQAHSAILVAVSAGPEAEAQAQELWRQEKPDEYFFLEIFASAVVEHLTTITGARSAPGPSPGRWRCCRGKARAMRSGAFPSSSGSLSCSAAPAGPPCRANFP